MAEQPGRPALNGFDQAVDAVLRVAGDEQVHVVGHRFKLDDRRIFLSADLWHDLLEAFVNSTRDDGPAVLRAAGNMEGAAVYDVVVRSGLVHPSTI